MRNTSTHFITEEYEAIYVSVLQACVFNFVDKMMEFHNVDMTQVIPENFITLSVRLKSLNETEIRGKYEKQVAERLLATNDALQPLLEENNSAFAIRVEHYHYATKKREEAKKDKITLLYNGAATELNRYHFQNFTAYFGIKENEKCVLHIKYLPSHSIVIHNRQ